MEEPSNKSAMMFLFGTLVGAVAVAIGSPYRGQEVRKKLKDTAHKVHNKGNNISDAVNV